MPNSRVALTIVAASAVALIAGCSSATTPSSQSIPTLAGSHRASSTYHHVKWLQRPSRRASVIPPELRPTQSSILLHRLQSGARPAPQVFTRGVYASEFEGPDILGYAMPNTGNNPPTCQVPAANVNDVNVDPVGDLIDPDGGTGTVIVYKGPTGCGTELGSFVDPFGQPSDAVSINAATDTIAVGNIFDNSGTAPGGISVCTLTGPINCPT